MKIVQSLWIGSELTRMEIACIKSFLSLGYEYHLYTYEKIKVPKKTHLLNANEIIDKSKIFKYSGDIKNGGQSYSGFSNFFRFKLLKDKGGIWVDTDIYCLKPLPEKDFIIIQESSDCYASCIIKCPKESILASECYNFCINSNPEKLKWGETGPKLVTKIAKKYNIKPENKELFFPISHQEINKFIEETNIPNNAITIHFWNEIWRRKGMSKKNVYSSSTLYEKLIEKSTSSKFL